MAHYGRTIKKHRDALGLSLERATQRANQQLPERSWRSYGYLNRIETGKISESEVDLVFLAAMISTLEAKPEEMPRTLWEDIREAKEAAEQVFASWDWIAA